MCLNHNVVHKLYIYKEISRLGWLIEAIFKFNLWQYKRQWSLVIVSIVLLRTDLKYFHLTQYYTECLFMASAKSYLQGSCFKKKIEIWKIFIKLNQIKIKYEVYIPPKPGEYSEYLINSVFCGSKFCMDTNDSQY